MSLSQTLFRNLGTKLLALAIACVAWYLLTGERRERISERSYRIPLSIVNIPRGTLTVSPLPDAVDDVTAASLGCRFATAFRAVVDQAAVGAGDWLAVFGAGGVGLMGEAGPEAILPLARGSDGKLGIRAGGGGAVHVTMNISTPDVAGFRRSQSQVAAEMSRAIQREASSEWPPRSKKLSSTPGASTPSVAAIAVATRCSSSSRGACCARVPLPVAVSGAGSRARSTLPLGESGIASSIT